MTSDDGMTTSSFASPTTYGGPIPPITDGLSASEIEQAGRRRAEQLARTMGANGVAAIAAERHRQQTALGYTLDHDQHHNGGELVRAALAYLTLADGWGDDSAGEAAQEWWPWMSSDLRADSREDALAKAGAMIAAEIDRHRYAEAQRAVGTPR